MARKTIGQWSVVLNFLSSFEATQSLAVGKLCRIRKVNG
jgi:hypothetical protein